MNKVRSKKGIYLSVVIPVYNEEKSLEKLYQRLIQILQKLDKSWELIFTNDGSTDCSYNILKAIYKKMPKHIRIITFNKNFGQHMAIMAAFEKARGEIIITLDADLQNPPEEIPNLISKYEQGYDFINGVRVDRKDNFLRKLLSKLSNVVREHITGIKIKDHGCMLKAYDKKIVQQVVDCNESSTFITVLAYSFANNPIDIAVKHDFRKLGESKYSLFKLIDYSLDMFTSLSTAPIRLFTIFGIIVSIMNIVLVIYLFVRRLLLGPEAEGIFTLFAIAFLLIAVAVTGIGVIGEYTGRIYQLVRKRPRFVIKEILEDNNCE